MFPIDPILATNDITAIDVLNWVLPAVGVLAAIVVIYFVWRYLRQSDDIGRVSEFNEKTFKKIIKNKETEHLPNCSNCKMPMRVEIKYRDFMKDTGDFLISKDALEQTTKTLTESGRISEEDRVNIVTFFVENPDIKQQVFRRYKCPNCSDVHVIPYLVQISTE